MISISNYFFYFSDSNNSNSSVLSYNFIFILSGTTKNCAINRIILAKNILRIFSFSLE